MGNKDVDDVWPNPNDRTPEVPCNACGKVTMHQRREDGGLACVSCRVRAQVEAEHVAAAGLMRFCGTCAGATLHDGYGCTRCRFILQTANAARHAKASHARRNGAGAILLVVGVLGSGFFHCTYGGNHGPDVCVKEEWGYYDQFIDMDEIEGQPIITLVSRARTIRALLRAGIISLPPGFADD